MNIDQIAAEAAGKLYDRLYYPIGWTRETFVELFQSFFKSAIEKAIKQNNLAWGRRIGEKDNHIRALSRAAHASEPLKVNEIAICENCGSQQHDQIDHICTTCNQAKLVNLKDILEEGRDWLKARAAHASERFENDATLAHNKAAHASEQ